MQKNSSHVMNCGVASRIAGYIKSGDHEKCVDEKTKCKYKTVAWVMTYIFSELIAVLEKNAVKIYKI